MKYIGWRIVAITEDEEEIDIVDMPNYVANAVDEWLSELESEEE